MAKFGVMLIDVEDRPCTYLQARWLDDGLALAKGAYMKVSARNLEDAELHRTRQHLVLADFGDEYSLATH